MHLIWIIRLHRMLLHRHPDSIIFTYHSIDSKSHIGMNVLHPDKFRQHIHYIKDCNKSAKDKHQIRISFDDGYESVFNYAFPIMEEYDLKGIIFPVTGYIGRYNDWDINFGINSARHLSSTQILKLSNFGWEIGSHGHSHRAYSRMKAFEIYQDLEISKRILEGITGKQVESFCPPFGVLTDECIEIITKTGYKNLFLQMPYIKKNIKTGNLNFMYTRSIYSIDNILSLDQKNNNFKRELFKENVIHSFARASIIVKEFL